MRSSAKELGASTEAKHFKEEAGKHHEAAEKWLKASIALTFAVIGLAAVFFIFPTTMPSNADVWFVVQRIAAKLILISVLSSLLVFCVRNYGTSRHNFIVNQHRTNALGTFQTFVQGTADPETKNQVLLQATKCIFTAQSSGYLRKEPDLGGGNQIVEVVRAATGKP